MELPWNDPDFKAVWEEWIEYRKERKLPKYVPKGLQKTLSMLQNISNDNKDTAIKIIEQSMQNNWAGLFKLKQDGTSNQQRTNANGAEKLGTSAARIEALKKW